MKRVRSACVGALCAGVWCVGGVLAQGSPGGALGAPANGPKRVERGYVALRGATAHPRPGEVIEHATLVLRDGRIEWVRGGEQEAPAAPAGSREIDAKGLHLYPGLVEAYGEVDVARTPGAGAHWNEHVSPERDAAEGTAGVASLGESLRGLGFAVCGIGPRGGVIRGKVAVVSLAKASEDPSMPRPAVLRRGVMESLSFERRGGGYPNSQMGAIALIRQTLLDARWQAQGRREGWFAEAGNCLDSLADESVALLMDVEDELEAFRALKLGQEFGRGVVLLGSGREYRRLGALGEARGSTGGWVIAPMSYLRAPDVSSPGKADAVDLKDLMGWEQAPTNAARLAEAGWRVALSTHRLREKGQFWGNVRSAIAHGLSEEAALAVLTTLPAELLGVSREVGTLEAGKRANVLVADGRLFEAKTKLRGLWVDGAYHELARVPGELEGEWDIEVAGLEGEATWLEVGAGNAVTVHRGAKKVKGERVEWTGDRLSYTFDHGALGGGAGVCTVWALVDLSGTPAAMRGAVVLPDGREVAFTGKRRAKVPAHPALGEWRVIEADGQPRDPESEEDGLTILVEKERIKLTFKKAGDEPDVEIETKDVTLGEGGTMAFTHELAKLGMEGVSKDSVRIEGGASAGPEDDVLRGESELPAGGRHWYVAQRAPDEAAREKKKLAERAKDVPKELGIPFGAYGVVTPPEARAVLIRGATLWTQGPRGVIEDAGVLVEEGKIAWVGEGVPEALPAGVEEWDAAGKHVTPGIIDCHSHTGLSKGTNESGMAVTCQVRIADVTDPDDVDWYRQLAGGVTCVNSLHGSANAIGGQSQTNKIRWGSVSPDGMHLEGAKPGVKFALGENPRGANWAQNDGARYPQTRMGVEMQIRDRLQAAREYARDRADAGKHARRDLQLEALAEVLSGDRIVHAHSYRQDEILMLARVAEEYGFKIGTYQHIREGYKVAEFVRDFSGGGSAFADWWAYKVEVQDAIPQGPVIMHEVGCVVSYNSDSDEMARRMNVEAGKAVKYGGLEDAAALDFVTMNPARQLRIDDRVGSIEVGKDADLALWSGPPLSSLSRCEATWIDGRRYFSLADDAAHREQIASERSRILQKLLKEDGPRRGSAGGAGPARGGARRRGPRPEHEHGAMARAEEEHRSGRAIGAGHPGTCGCDEVGGEDEFEDRD